MGGVSGFYEGDKPSVDDDNMVKPVGDVLNGLVDEVNRQFRHSETYHMPIDDPNKGATAMLVAR